MKKYKITKFKLYAHLKCPKCGYKNVTQASYCYKCGYKFKEEEKKEVLNNSVSTSGRLYFKWKDRFNIWGWKTFQFISLLMVIIPGIKGIYKEGYKLLLKNSDNYYVQYNDENNEYYLYMSEDTGKVDLYIPYTVKNIYVKHCMESNCENYKTFSAKEDINLPVDNDSSYYYLLSMKEKDYKENEYIKVLTFTQKGLKFEEVNDEKE